MYKGQDEYYVAGRRIPAMYNGMATAADWMSAASFISLAGALYLQGYSGSGNQPGGLAYVIGWTGGFLSLSPILRLRRIARLKGRARRGCLENKSRVGVG